MDFSSLKKPILISSIIGRDVPLKQSGAEHEGLCPFHKDTNIGNFKVNDRKGIYSCFACGAKGDVFDYLKAAHGLGLQKAIKYLGHTEVLRTTKPNKQTGDWIPIHPVPDDAPKNPNFKHYKFGKPTVKYAYSDADDNLLGYTCRFEYTDENGKPTKSILPFTYCEHSVTKKRKWLYKGFKKPRPLYGLENIAGAHRILIVEGEKCKDAAQAALPDYVVVTWIGGIDGVEHTSWSVLDGKDVTIWPDDDKHVDEKTSTIKPRDAQPGYRAAYAIQQLLPHAKILDLPDGKPDGWDVADAITDGWDNQKIIQFISDHSVLITSALPVQQQQLPVIHIRGGGLSDAATEGEKALIAANVQFYQRGNNLVRLITNEVDAANGKRTKVAQLVVIDQDYLLDILCRSASWVRFDRRSNEYVMIDPPAYVAKTISSRNGEWSFPTISGVITTQTLRPDGSLLHIAGYDSETRLLLVDPPAIPKIPDSPTKEDAIKALAQLDELLSEFSFLDDASRSVALSALITPVVRGAFSVAPMHAIRAHMAGSGKSFLLDVSAAIATGQRCPVMAAGKTAEETEKRLVAAVIAGRPIISIDNVNGELGGDCLCQIVERPNVDVRMLGKSELVSIESRSTVFATGNNLCLVDDMTRRVILCTLDANLERPELRHFTKNPFDMVLANRGSYIAAILTIVRAYIVAEKSILIPQLASFEGWSNMVRSPLIWLDRADPVQTMDNARKEDPTLQTMATVFMAMYDSFGITKKTAAEIIKNAGSKGTLSDALMAAVDSKDGHINARQLGQWLKRYKGRIVNNLRLDSKFDNHGHPILWYLSNLAVTAV